MAHLKGVAKIGDARVHGCFN
ncbi:hypothetical protein SCOCK_20160 [Actinacidiphila cocklensis]|uniref:Uncharacterized protein n=1 Tax=Actinacidiphila cocklensis TaxID=887465 RepID=A0A9W4DN09_9ACTN|nr:hypothetical protein SCOCK_20160 [Actinacidiphila cocklensis]